MFGAPTPSVDEQREAWANGLLEIRATLVEPLVDIADGMKADLIARGWSPTVAEHLAATWLAAMLARVGAA
ncbi:hypothetical protein [Streptomyces sp. NTK 937]|uniref:hypothetical protein n=1 Tax=Streptomyces sp. NTK 937 TaxID=1487711 RepID=UPI0004A9522D|nr:hypothetical protein [Streptomyces sp. NTK 937]KDQ65732.1 hypothetical protein DT87_00300 [Streptomyces sp. NTK 937]